MLPIGQEPCWVCLKTANCDNAKVSLHFAKLVPRFCGYSAKWGKGLETGWKLNLCDNCALLGNAFCGIYDQLRCLELRLEGSLEKIVGVMKMANRVPERWRGLEQAVGERESKGDSVGETSREEFQRFKDFRKKLLQKARARLKTSLPRVLLETLKEIPGGSAKPKAEVEEKLDTEYFLGWIATLAAVTFMACCSSSELGSFNAGNCFDDTEDNLSDIPDNGHTDRYNETVVSACEIDTRPESDLIHVDIVNQIDFKQEFDTFSGSNFDECTSLPENCDMKEDIKVAVPQTPKLWSCTICQKEYRQKLKLNKHVRVVHFNKKRKYNCRVCQRSFPNYKGLRVHKFSMNHQFIRNFSQKSSGQCDSRKLIVPGILNNDTPTPETLQTTQINQQAIPQSSHHYGLRRNRKRNYTNLDAGPNSDQEFAEESSCSSSSYASETETLEPEVNKNSSKPNHVSRCGRDGCQTRIPRVKNAKYFMHQKLHLPQRIKCQFCNFMGENLLKLSLHEASEHGRHLAKLSKKPKTFSCARCSYESKFKGAYQKHFAEYHIGGFDWRRGRRNFKFCKICGFFVNMKNGHFAEYHGTSGGGTKTVIKCTMPHCSAYFCKQAQLSEHSGKVHQHQLQAYKSKNSLQIDQSYYGKFKCEFCSQVLDYAPDLATHELTHGSLNLNPPKKRTREKSANYPCPRCFATHDSKNRYVRHHLKTHLELKLVTIPCDICDAQYFTQSGLNKHKKEHHTGSKDALKCDLCPAVFASVYSLIFHKSKFHWNRKCPDCGEAFTQFENPHARLRLHIEQHHPTYLPQLRFHCALQNCWRRFATQEELDKHRKENKCEKENLICAQCGKIFETSFKSQIHLKIAHADRSFVCEQCGKGFKTQAGLTTHVNSHLEPHQREWQCSKCGKKLAAKQNLEQHMRTHSKEKPFVCQFCGKGIAHFHNFKNHLKVKHGVTAESKGKGRPGPREKTLI